MHFALLALLPAALLPTPSPSAPTSIPALAPDTALRAQLPTDPASIFAIILILGVAGAVIWYGRPRGGGGAPR